MLVSCNSCDVHLVAPQSICILKFSTAVDRRFSVTSHVQPQLVTQGCEDGCRTVFQCDRGNRLLCPTTPTCLDHLQSISCLAVIFLLTVFELSKCLKACNKFENCDCDMADMSVIEIILCGQKLDVISHFLLSQLPYSEKKNYAFNFNLTIFNSR